MRLDEFVSQLDAIDPWSMGQQYRLQGVLATLERFKTQRAISLVMRAYAYGDLITKKAAAAVMAGFEQKEGERLFVEVANLENRVKTHARQALGRTLGARTGSARSRNNGRNDYLTSLQTDG
jgi:imidazolonepropionase-like amidohydrolase